MDEVIGRTEEKDILNGILKSNQPELVAMFGRRRVGKTYLIRKYLKGNLIFEFSGVHNATVAEQLTNFRNTFAEAMNLPVTPAIPANWTEAFQMLKKYAEPLLKKKNALFFLTNFRG